MNIMENYECQCACFNSETTQRILIKICIDHPEGVSEQGVEENIWTKEG
jgi:hypothetical protein